MIRYGNREHIFLFKWAVLWRGLGKKGCFHLNSTSWLYKTRILECDQNVVLSSYTMLATLHCRFYISVWTFIFNLNPWSSNINYLFQLTDWFITIHEAFSALQYCHQILIKPIKELHLVSGLKYILEESCWLLGVLQALGFLIFEDPHDYQSH